MRYVRVIRPTFFANASIAGATYDFMINGVSYQNSTTQLFDPLGYGQTIGNGDIVSVSAITVAASCSSNITSITMFENIISSAGTITTVTETICQGQTAPPMIGTDQSGQVSGSLSYQWQVSSDNIFYNNIAFANSQNYTPTSILNTNTFYRRLTVSDTGTNTCSEPSNPIRIRIDNTIIASISVVQGGINKVASDTLNICIDDEIIFYAAPTNVGYSYEFSVNNIAVQVRSSQSSFSTNNLLNNDDVRVEVFNGVVSDTSACSDISEAFNIITSPSPVVTLNSDATGGVFCEGDDILFTASSNFASSTYEFIINSTTYQSSSSNTFRPIGLVPPVSLNDGDIVSVQVIGNPYSGASCSSIATISLTENIIFDPGIIGTITDTICSGDLPSILTEQAGTVSASGAISYRWESSIDSISYNPIPFTNSSTYSPGALVQTTNFIRYTISELNGVICEEPSNILTINVVAPISGGTISPNNQSICNGETPLILEVIGGASGMAISYQWQVSSDGVSFTNITTATSRDYQPPALLESQYYRRQTIGPGGLTSDCSALSSVTFIRVRDIDPGALDPNLNQTYCYGAIPPSLISSMTVGGIQMDATDDGAGTITYQWEISVDNASWTSISSATNNFYNPPSLTQTTWFRRLARSSVSTDVFCQETTNSIRIEILPDLNAGFVLDDQSICQIVSAIDLPETLVLNASEAITNSVTVQWQRSDNQYRWSDISEQRSANLTFNLGDSWLPTMPVTYYRAVITYVGDPQTSNLEQTSIRFDNNGVGFSGGQNYSIIINGTEYGITSTATDSLDSIGDKFANKVSLENFNVNAEYNSDNNILTIVPLVADTYNVAASTGSPSPTIAFISPINAEFGYKILVQGNTGARLPNTMMESCQVYTDPVAIEVTSPHILNQVNGDNSPQGICEGDSIDPITFNFGGGATSIEIQGLDDGLTITPGAGGTVTTNLYGLDDWYEVSGTNSFTISGNINGNSIVNLLSVGIDGCTVVNESYEFRILPNGIVPDFIRMGTNAKGFEVINQTIDGVDYWFNNTVCQDNLPAPTTPETEFFACYLDNELNSIFYQYFWDFEPPTAGNMIQNTFTQYSIGIIQNASTNTLGVDYVISVNASGTSQTYSITTNVGLETADQVGLALANLINTNPNVSSYYNNQIDEITIESRFANMVYTSSSSPTGVNQSLRLTPPAQRDIIRSGTMQWNPSFSGTSTIRVRAVGCDVSDWLEVQIDVVPQALVNTPTVSSLIEPVALNVQVCGGEFTGALPTCEITDATPSTQFFTASDNGNLPNEFDSLEWNISNPQPGAGSLVANPGLIDQLTGTIDWNTGWWGSFELLVRPVSCSGVVGDWKSRTIVIGQQNGPVTSVTAVGNLLPECPIPAGGYTSTLTTGGDPVRWYVNSQAGLATSTTYLASNTVFELDPGADMSTLELNFRPGFSGNIIIAVEPTPCPGERVNYVISVPGPPRINLTSGFNSNNQELCAGTAMNTITYEIEGAANRVRAINLPTGITPFLEITSQLTTITLSTLSSTTIGRTYSISIDNYRYDFVTTATVVNAADHVGNGLAAAINAGTNNFVATYNGGNLTIEVGPSGQPGNSFSVASTQPVNSAVNFAAPIASPLSKVFSLFGTPTQTATVINYQIETEAPQLGCAVAVASGTIELYEEASLEVVPGLGPAASYCGIEDLSLNPIVLTFEGANGIIISPTSPNPLPNGLSIGLQSGFYDRFIITGTMNEIVSIPRTWDVEFITNGGACGEVTETISFNLVPQPVVRLISSGTTDRTACTSSTLDPIRFEIANPAFTLTETALSEYPAGISGQAYAQLQQTDIILEELTAGASTTLGDVFTVNINGTAYMARSGIELSSATSNLTQLAAELTTYLQGQVSPTYTVTNNNPNIRIESNFPGVAFSTSLISSSTGIRFNPTPDLVQSPAYYEISGTISTTAAVGGNPRSYVYELQSAGAGICTGSIAVSGTINVDPSTSASFASGDQNPSICIGRSARAVYSSNSVLSIAVVASTPSWITASHDPLTGDITVDFNPPGSLVITTTQVFNYEITLRGNAFGCTTTPTPISGTVTISPDDIITFVGSLGDDEQIICVGNTPSPTFAFDPIEYQLSGGATSINTITYRQDGGPSQGGLPPGFGYSFNASNTLIISGIATADAANTVSSTTIYTYEIVTAGSACVSDTAIGTIEVRTAPDLTLTSSASTDNQVICDGIEAIDDIIYTLGPGADQVLFTWTSGGTVTGLTASYNNPAQTEFIITGTPAMNVTQTTVYNYQIETVGSDCAPEIVLTGSIQLEPQDTISLIVTPSLTIVSGIASQTVCYMDRDNPANALAEPIQPIEYQLIGGAVGRPVTVSYRENGGALINGLPAGLGYSITPSNTVLITGSIVASTTYVTPTMFYEYVIETTGGCVTDTISGYITTLSPPVMTLVSTASTANQVICDATPIANIVYEIQGGATTFAFNWVGSNTLVGTGITTTNSGTNRYVIAGTPIVNVTQTTVYNYEIVTTGSACVSDVTMYGSIQLEPVDAISLVSSPSTANQSVCLFDSDNASNTIAELMAPIEYQLEGGAIGSPFTITYTANGGAVQNGLPPGLGYTLTPSNTILISGSIIASTTFTTPTVNYTYQIVTGGSCAPAPPIGGTITVHSPPVLELTSGLTTTNQVGFFAVCDRQDAIADIVYTFEGGTTNVVFTWTGPTLNGVNGVIPSGTNNLVISGTPSVNITAITLYPYQVTTAGSACAPEIVYTGVIEVKPEELLVLSSAPSTENQTICAGTGTNTLDPIIYNLEQEAISAVVSFTPALPGIGYTLTSTQVIISGVAQAAAQASTTISTFTYEVQTTGCGPARESGTIIILPTPVMSLYNGNPNQPSVCNNSPIDPVDYIFNPQSGATFSITWDETPAGISATLASGAGGTNNIVRVLGTPSVQVSSTTTYNYQITLSGTCDPDVVVNGSITVDPGPIIDANYIQDFLVFGVACNGDNTGSIVLGDPTDPDFLNAITSVTPGRVQISEINFTPSSVVTYTDIFRVYINGTEYNTRGGQTVGGVNSVYSNADIINDLVSRINNDPAQQDVQASLSGFGLRLIGTVEGISFTVSANTSDTAAITNTATTTQIAATYTPVLRWIYPDSSVVNATDIYNLYAGEYTLEVIVNSCLSSATFVVEEPPALGFDVDFCGGVTGAITVQASGGIAPYTYTIEYNGVRLPGASGISVTNGQANFAGLTPGRLYVVEVSDTSSCSLPLTRAVRIPTALNFDTTIVEVTDSYCSTGTTGNGSIFTTKLVGGVQVNAFTGGSGLYDYSWAESLTATRVLGTTPNLENLPPGDYYLTITDAVLGCEYPPQLITVGGYASVRFNGVETANFVNQRGSGSGTGTATADFIYTLECFGEADASFDLFAVGGSGNLQITAVTPGLVIPPGTGSAVSLSNLAAGTYVFRATDLSPPSDPDGNLLPACTDVITVRVVQPEPYRVQIIEEGTRVPACPEDLTLGGRLVFEISGGNSFAAPYTVQLNDGVLSAISASNNQVEFDGIDVRNPAMRTIFNLEIIDSFGCSSGVITSTTFTFPEIYEYQVNNFEVTDIDCVNATSGQMTFEIVAAATNPSAPSISPINEGQLFITSADGGNYTYYKVLDGSLNAGDPIVLVDNFRQAGDYTYEVSINNTNTAACVVASGTFTIEEVNNQQMRVGRPEVNLPGCGNSESSIALTIENFIPPLRIEWYEFTSTTSSTINSVTGATINATTTTGWVPLDSSYDGLAVVTGLPTGIYRAIITDSRESTCDGGEFITRNISISEGSLNVTNFRSRENIPPIGNGECRNYPEPSDNAIDWNNTDQGYSHDVFFNVNLSVDRSFSVTQTTNNGFYMELVDPDGRQVPLDNSNIFAGRVESRGGRYLFLEPRGYTYRFRNLPGGSYYLRVIENVDNTSLTPCEEIYYFTVREFLPIEYNGDTTFVTDLCTGAVDGGITASALGGDPFIVDGVPTYQFEWTYTPNDPTASTQVFYGERVDPAYPGQYCLRILDRNSHSYCSCDVAETNPVTIEVEDVVQPFFTEGILTDPDNLGTIVKSLPPDCASGGLNGQIGLQISGGQLPYVINWFVEDPRYLNTEDNIGYRPLNEYQNRTSLQDLLPGNYKMQIVSLANTGCSGPNQYTFYEEIIQVSPNRELYIMDGPFVDEDLCTGQQGRLLVNIFDNNNGNLSFYYNDILIPSSDVVRLSDRSWSVAIVNAVDEAEFRIVNQEGCWITTDINRGIGEPNYSYTSPNFEASSVILAREEITFENTSTDPYVRSEWIFGDNTPAVDAPILIDSIIPVRHTYGISGTYFATMRIYNDVGCSEEITQPITVGKGYNILVPNVFTPNNDLVNDNFRPLFSGFSNMTFTVYDYRGNVVYNEYVEEADLNNIQGISITGWDGSLAPFSPYYIYTAYGILLDGETEVEKSGTFIVIN